MGYTFDDTTPNPVRSPACGIRFCADRIARLAVHPGRARSGSGRVPTRLNPLSARGGPEWETANVTSMADETRLERWLDRMLARAATPRGAGVVIATATTSMTLAAGLLMRVVDHDNFPSFGSGLWWAVQTVTTVGYGDEVPTNASGPLLAALVMLLGSGYLTVITA